jgi:glycosyltransferase involved in cell wall biosynthesis
MITAAGLEKHFIFAGMLDNIEQELAGSDLMIHPAIEEPFSHAILEASRAGLPIVASRIGGIPEAVEENKTAFLVEPRRPAELAEAVNRMLAEKDLRLRFGLAGQQRWRENFRVETMVDRTEAYFGELLGREVKV